MKHIDPIALEVELLIQAVYLRFQYDFRQYSRSSVRRRLEQAMTRFQCGSITELQKRIIHEENFFPQLIPYLTVNTTEMFRDPSYFKSLREKVFPVLQTYPSIKIWVAGCSTGEEVFSLAILLRELGMKKYLIYATDINPMNLIKAKAGIYNSEDIKKACRNYKLSGGLTTLSDYFEAAYDSVRFDPTLLENVVFSDHSLSTDMVFSETHFISCRNVMIYFDRNLQDRALNLFRESLNRDGFLGLGDKETIHFSCVKNDFTTFDQENRLYQKRQV